MPEFILNTDAAPDAWDNCDDFTKGFIEALFFTNSCAFDDDSTIENWWNEETQSDLVEGRLDGCLPCDAGIAELWPDSLAKVAEYCTKWQADHADLLQRAYNAHWQKAAEKAGWTRVAHNGMFNAPLGHEVRLVEFDSWQELCECEGIEPGEEYDATQAGRDVFYEREGHGVGFSDRDVLNVGDLQAKLSEAVGRHEAQIWFGDHVENGNAPWVYIAL